MVNVKKSAPPNDTLMERSSIQKLVMQLKMTMTMILRMVVVMLLMMMQLI